MKIEFIQSDFQALEAKYPQGYWYLYSVAMERATREMDIKLAELSPKKETT